LDVAAISRGQGKGNQIMATNTKMNAQRAGVLGGVLDVRRTTCCIARFTGGQIGVLLDRGEQWQVAYVIAKGTYRDLRDAGLAELRENFARVRPEVADRLDHLSEWHQVSVLSVAADRLPKWHRPGLLMIGDAAHVMSPVAGVGINNAIQDAIVAANVLGEPLKEGRVGRRELAAVQRRREWPTRAIQALQTQVQHRVIARGLDPTEPFSPPKFMRLLPRIPILRKLAPRLIGFGIWPVHVRREGRTPLSLGQHEGGAHSLAQTAHAVVGSKWRKG
jgi:2-polyprenyl-6-methoxyphenol hydroxylase-like FAD-dependent oxidoreductase